jgi:hypothetical protein
LKKIEEETSYTYRPKLCEKSKLMISVKQSEGGSDFVARNQILLEK